MNQYCYINGKILEEKNAHISPYDLGILRGYGVFDFMCTTNGKPFHINDHWKRVGKTLVFLLEASIENRGFSKSVSNVRFLPAQRFLDKFKSNRLI